MLEGKKKTQNTQQTSLAGKFLHNTRILVGNVYKEKAADYWWVSLNIWREWLSQALVTMDRKKPPVYYCHTTMKEVFLSASKVTKEYKSMEKPSLIEPSLSSEERAY